MTTYRERVADVIVRDALASFGALIIEGPRAVGKTTTGLRHSASSVRLDSSPQVADLAEVAPGAVLSGAVPRLLDEWQLAPTLWNAVRHEVDHRGLPGQFILTGSATPADDQTRHSGAGRFRRVRLRPMALAESGESTRTVNLRSILVGEPAGAFGGPTVEEYAQLIVRGGWPSLVDAPQRSATDYLTSYLDDISRVDLPEMGVRVDPVRMRALIRALARNIATEIPLAKLAREAEIGPDAAATSAQTARRHIDALTRVFVVEELPAWAPHLRSKVRLRVQPVWHFADPSLAAAVLGASPQRLLADLETFGFFFESLCVRDLRVYAEALGGDLFHYRDETGLEVDAILELRDGTWAAFEVKLGGAKAIDTAARSLHALAAKVSSQRASELKAKVVLTAGNASYARPDGVQVVSIGHLFTT
ncbi:ATP-binding protein [Microbacterium sp. A93]|uniref:ATP-binding protein n=1 Tax=Microbacterium sp. A93 TaxID=3450716 RepID=UPI003F4363C3